MRKWPLETPANGGLQWKYCNGSTEMGTVIGEL